MRVVKPACLVINFMIVSQLDELTPQHTLEFSLIFCVKYNFVYFNFFSLTLDY